MKYFRRGIAISLVLVLSFSLMACAKKKESKYQPIADDNETVYNISICQDSDSDFYNAILQGFTDSLTDYFGEKHLAISTQIANDEHSVSDIVSQLSSNSTNLIFANGSKSLSQASAATDFIPIIGAGVIDFKNTLHLTGSSNSQWNQKTDTNVTGVSAMPDIEAQLSLLIEATPDLKSVGILYCADDTTAIYQNQQLEKYLDQAGIPWKEYAISLPSDVAYVETDAIDTSVITPIKIVAPSISEGPNATPATLGGSNLLNGILAPGSAHAAAVSSFWTEELSIANPEPLAEDASTEDIIKYASQECSCFYVSAESHLDEQMSFISSIATEAGKPIIAGDLTLANNALVTLYSDPYAMGYQAGKIAYRILINEEYPGEIKVSPSSAENVKLYNGEIAETLQRTFPKSFQEMNTFLESYEIGSTTTHYTGNSPE